MNKKQIAIGAIGILLILGICAGFCGSAAAAPPLLPHAFFGNVTNASGVAIPAGMVITAEVDGQTFSYPITQNGKIGASGTFGDKFQLTSSTNNTPITFKLGQFTATGTYTYIAGDVSDINLVFPIQTVDAPVISNFSDAGISYSSPTQIVISDTVSLPAGFSIIIVEDTGNVSSAPSDLTPYKVYNITLSDSSIQTSAFLTFSVSSDKLYTSFRNNKDSIRFYHGVGTSWNEANIKSAVTSGSTTTVTFFAESFSPYLSGSSTLVPVIPGVAPTTSPGSGGDHGQSVLLPAIGGIDPTIGDTHLSDTSEFLSTPLTTADTTADSEDGGEEEVVDTSLSDLVAALVGGDPNAPQADAGDPQSDSGSRNRGQTIILAAKELEKDIHEVLSSIGLGHVPVVAVVFPVTFIIIALIILGVLAIVRRTIVIRNRKQKKNDELSSGVSGTQTPAKRCSLFDKLKNRRKQN